MDNLIQSTGVHHHPDPEFVDSANITAFMRTHEIEDYAELLTRSTGDRTRESGLEWFWDEIVDFLDIEFYADYDTVADRSSGPQFTDWYLGGTINIAHNVVDRHADSIGDKAACIWEGEGGQTRNITFRQLSKKSNRIANLLTDQDIETGDTVGLFMPPIPETIAALYGCFKTGAIAVPLFSGYGTDALATRINDADISIMFTADGFYRGGKEIPLKQTLDTAIESTQSVNQIIVYDRLGTANLDAPRDQAWGDAVESRSDSFTTKRLDSETPSMLLYTSGTTGKPKGTVQTHAGQLVKYAKDIYFDFDHKPSDRFFWVTDLGWIMGPWTLIGNHAFGGTVFMYEGAPDHPEPDRLWRLIEQHSITTLGTSPTAIRSFMGDEELIEARDLTSLRLLGSTGEPWDPESWKWFYKKVGKSETPIVNVSGGTEMGGHFLSSPPIMPLKPCTVGKPTPGINADIVTDQGESITEPNQRGHLVVRNSCPSMTKSLWSGNDRYLDEYWSRWDGLWDHGDWVNQDADGLWYILGRADDIINIAGRTIGPAEIEAIILDHEAVTEAAAIGVRDEIKGQALVLFVVGETQNNEEQLRNALRNNIDKQFGKPFRPDEIIFTDAIPKNQSDKVLRKKLQSRYNS